METITTIILRALFIMWFVCVWMIIYLCTRPVKDEWAITCFCVFMLFIPFLILWIALAN